MLVKAQYRADVQASKATTADLYEQKKALVVEYKTVRQKSVDRVRQINQAMRVVRSDFATTRSAINAEMRTVRTAQMQLRRNYNIARRTMNAEDFAVFNAAYSE